MAVRAPIVLGSPADLVRRVPPLHAALRRARAALRGVYVRSLRLRGIEAACRALARCTPALRAEILRAFGARIGPGTAIHGPLHLMNAKGDFAGLEIGAESYLGPDLLIDLTAPVSIGDRVAISARCSLVTHRDVGASRLAARYPPVAGRVAVGDDAYLGVGSVLLHGVTIGARSVVAAGAVVRDEIPSDAVAAGQPARVVKRLAAEGASE